jgi:hypothetical protein
LAASLIRSAYTALVGTITVDPPSASWYCTPSALSWSTTPEASVPDRPENSGVMVGLVVQAYSPNPATSTAAAAITANTRWARLNWWTVLVSRVTADWSAAGIRPASS